MLIAEQPTTQEVISALVVLRKCEDYQKIVANYPVVSPAGIISDGSDVFLASTESRLNGGQPRSPRGKHGGTHAYRRRIINDSRVVEKYFGHLMICDVQPNCTLIEYLYTYFPVKGKHAVKVHHV